MLYGPQAARGQVGHSAELGAQLLASQSLESEKLLGAVERERLSAARLGIESVRELRDLAGGLVSERERPTPSWDQLVQSLRVLLGLGQHAFERVSCGLGFDDANRAAVGVEQVVCRARLGLRSLHPPQRKLPNGHAAPGVDVHGRAVLNRPPAVLKLPVDLLPGALFGRQWHWTLAGSVVAVRPTRSARPRSREPRSGIS